MELHKNARSCPASRTAADSADSGRHPREQRRRGGRCFPPDCLLNGRGRYQLDGSAALLDRSSRPHRLPRQTPPDRVEEILRLRRRRKTGPQIASRVGSSPATVARVLAREGLSRLKNLEPEAAPPPLPERPPRRAHPYRHQEAGPHQVIGHRIHGNRRQRGRGPAGSSSTSPSTTPLASLMPRSSLTKDPRPLPPSLDDWSPGIQSHGVTRHRPS